MAVDEFCEALAMPWLHLLPKLDYDHLLLTVLWDFKMANCVLSVTEHHAKEILRKVIDQRMYACLVSSK